MSNIELKPCPFCGKSVARIITVAEADRCQGDKWADTHYITVCDYHKGGCGSGGTCNNETREQAAEAWNRRADNG